MSDLPSYGADRLKPGVWVQAQIRLCDLSCIPAVVLKKGHGDFGAVLLKLYQGELGWAVFSQVRLNDGRPGWMRTPSKDAPPTPESGSEKEADAYIASQLDFDPDLWVLEVNDPAGLYHFDAEIT